MLKQIRLRNFRCFEDHIVPLKPVSLVVGRNNAGKSSLIEALRFTALATARHKTMAYRESAMEAVPMREVGFSPSLKGLAISFSNLCYGYAPSPAIIEAEFVGGARLKIYVSDEEEMHVVVYDTSGKIVKSAAQAALLKLPEVSILPQIGPLTPNEAPLTEDYVRKAVSSRLSSQHFRNQLYWMGDDWEGFVEMAEDSWPNLRIESLEFLGKNEHRHHALEIRNQDFVGEIGTMGHGLQMWLQTIWFLSRASAQGSVILDEPDVYMHPDLQRRLIRLIKSRFPQIVVATHSVEMMSEVGPSDILVLDRTRPSSQFTTSNPAVQGVIDAIGSVHNLQIARMWHARRCLFVEGEDLDYLTPLYDKVLPGAADGLGTLPYLEIGGWGGWQRVVGSAQFIHQAGDGQLRPYCILDRDYHTDGEIKERYESAKQNGVHLHIWDRKEIENYLLVPAAVARVIRRRVEGCEVTSLEVSDALMRIVGDLRESTTEALAEELRQRDKKLAVPTAMTQARDAMRVRWTNPADGLKVASGKTMLSALSAWSQKLYGVGFSGVTIASEMRQDEIDREMSELFLRISEGK